MFCAWIGRRARPYDVPNVALSNPPHQDPFSLQGMPRCALQAPLLNSIAASVAKDASVQSAAVLLARDAAAASGAYWVAAATVSPLLLPPQPCSPLRNAMGTLHVATTKSRRSALSHEGACRGAGGPPVGIQSRLGDALCAAECPRWPFSQSERSARRLWLRLTRTRHPR